MVNSNLKQNEEIIFSDEATLIIRKLVSEYNLESIEEKMFSEMVQAKTFKEREEIFEKLPGRQIAKTVKEVAQDKVSSKDLVPILKQRLNIPEEMAKKLAEALEKKVLILAQKILKEEVPPTEKIISPEKPTPQIEAESLPPVQEKPLPQKKDIYREDIE